MKNTKEEKSDYSCPICDQPLTWHEGGKMRKEGFTMYCDNPICPCEEVFGYSTSLEKCFDIIQGKYKN